MKFLNLLISAALLPSTMALAQIAPSTTTTGEVFPKHTVTLVVSAGGLVDTLARTIGPLLSERWKQPVIVEARPGASGTIGSEFVARAAPDGHTLMLNSAAAFAITPAVYKNLRFDPANDFTGVTLLGDVGFVLLVNPNQLNVKNMAEFQAAVRAAPGKYNYASPGAGTSHQFGMELLKQRMGLNMQHVPYKTVPAMITDLIGGQVQALLLSTTSGMPYVAAGRVKLLAVTGDTRVPSAPDVATFREQGLDYMDAIESWFGVIAPAKTPRPVIAKLNQDIRAVMELPQVREQMAKQGMVSKTGTPEEFDALVKADLLRWAKLASDMKITAE